MADRLLLLGHDELFTVTIAVECAACTEALLQSVAHGSIVAAAHVGEDVAEAFRCPDDARLLEVVALAVGIGIGIDTGAPCEVVGHVAACQEAQALLAQRAAAVEAERIRAGHKLKIKVFV